MSIQDDQLSRECRSQVADAARGRLELLVWGVARASRSSSEVQPPMPRIGNGSTVPSGGCVTYLEAAVAVLKASRRAMTIEEITTVAIRKGLIQPQGKTPAATMRAALYRDLRDAVAPALQRDFQPGAMRAARSSVRWRYVG
jgi:HB1, ASXL, restriction endonuclease HTH domain